MAKGKTNFATGFRALVDKIATSGSMRDTVTVESKKYSGYLFEIVEDDDVLTPVEDTMHDLGLITQDQGLKDVDMDINIMNKEHIVWLEDVDNKIALIFDDERDHEYIFVIA